MFTGRTDAEAEIPIFGHLMRRADSLERVLLQLKLQYFGPLMQRAESLEKTLMQKEKGNDRG